MSKISEYAARVDEKFSAIGDSVDTISTGITGVTKDVADLKKIILDMQNNPGPISVEDQALLDAGEAKVAALADKTKAVAEAITALDAQTEPPAPPTP